MPTIRLLLLLMFSVYLNLLPFSVELILRNKKKSGGDIWGKYGGGGLFNSGIPCFAKNCFVDTAVWGLALSCKTSQLPFSWNWGPNSANHLNQTRQYFSVIFLIHRLTWLNTSLVNDLTTVEECDQHHFVFWLLKLKLFVSCRAWRAPFHALYFCLGIKLETPGLITHTAESSKKRSSSTDWIRSWQACSLRAFCSSVKQCGTNLAQIFHYDSGHCFSSNFEFLFHHPKSHSTISWNQFPNCFDYVRRSNGCQSSTALHLQDFHGRPETLHTIWKPAYERKHCHLKPVLPVLSAGKFQ
jgi:hypothetical protein